MPSEIAEEYKNFCDRPKDQRPQREEVIGNGATYSTSELSVLKNNEVRTWDRGYDEEGNQVWGAIGGPYEFKPAPTSSFNDIFSHLNFPAQPLDKRIQELQPKNQKGDTSRNCPETIIDIPTTSSQNSARPAGVNNNAANQRPIQKPPCQIIGSFVYGIAIILLVIYGFWGPKNTTTVVAQSGSCKKSLMADVDEIGAVIHGRDYPVDSIPDIIAHDLRGIAHFDVRLQARYRYLNMSVTNLELQPKNQKGDTSSNLNQKGDTSRNCPESIIDIPTTSSQNSARPAGVNNNAANQRPIQKTPCQIIGSFVYGIAIILLVIYGFWGIIDSTIYSQNQPDFKIESILLDTTNISTSQISTNWTIGISVRNTNKHTHMIYDGFEVNLLYEGIQNLCTAKVGNFNQGPKNTTTVVAQSGSCKKSLMADVDEIGAVIHGRDYPVDSIPDIIAHDLRGIAHFDVRLQARYRYLNMSVTNLELQPKNQKGDTSSNLNQKGDTSRNCPESIIDIPTTSSQNSARPAGVNNNAANQRPIQKTPCQIIGSFVYGIAIILLVIYGFWGIIDSTIYSQNQPDFKIESILLDTTNISTSQISTNWTIGISVRNTNKHTHMIYDGFEVNLLYEGIQNLCTAKVGNFNQGPKNTTTVVAQSGSCKKSLMADVDEIGAVIHGRDYPVDSIPDIIAHDLRGIAHFDVRLQARYRYLNMSVTNLELQPKNQKGDTSSNLNQKGDTSRNCPESIIDIPTTSSQNSARPAGVNNNAANQRPIQKTPCQIIGSFVYGIAIILLVIYGFWGIIDSTIYSQNQPDFKIESILLDTTNISTSQISTNWTIGISVRNTNKHTHMIYDGFEVNLLYEGIQNLCTAKVGNFNQGPKNTTTVVAQSGSCKKSLMADVDEIGAVIHGRDYPVDSIPDIIAHDLRGIAHFDVRLQARYRYLNMSVTNLELQPKNQKGDTSSNLNQKGDTSRNCPESIIDIPTTSSQNSARPAGVNNNAANQRPIQKTPCQIIGSFVYGIAIILLVIYGFWGPKNTTTVVAQSGSCKKSLMADVDEIGAVIHGRDYPVDSIPDIIAHDLRGIAHFDVRLQARYRYLNMSVTNLELQPKNQKGDTSSNLNQKGDTSRNCPESIIDIPTTSSQNSARPAGVNNNAANQRPIQKTPCQIIGSFVYGIAIILLVIYGFWGPKNTTTVVAQSGSCKKSLMADVDEIGAVIHGRDYPVDSIPDIIAHDLRGIAHFDVRLQARYRYLNMSVTNLELQPKNQKGDTSSNLNQKGDTSRNCPESIIDIPTTSSQNSARPAGVNNNAANQRPIQKTPCQIIGSFVYGIAIILLVIYGFWGIIDSTIYSQNQPDFKIESILLDTTNISTSQISTNWTIGISVRNTNKHAHMIYDGFEVNLLYEGIQNLCTAKVGNFNQGPKNTTTVVAQSGSCKKSLMADVDEIGAVIQGRDYPVDSIPDIIAHDLRGIAHFDVRLQARYRYLNMSVTNLELQPKNQNGDTSRNCPETIIDIPTTSSQNSARPAGVNNNAANQRPIQNTPGQIIGSFVYGIAIILLVIYGFWGPKNTTTVVAQSGSCKKILMAYVDEIGTVIHSRDYPVDSIPDIIAHDLRGIVHFDVKLQVRYRYVGPIYPGKNWVHSKVLCEDVKIITPTKRTQHLQAMSSKNCRVKTPWFWVRVG
ncbi:hypothetical protein ACH5RR_024773 [Cinchona calisaya]|uniref:Late embryogenesis abundant protein LEA-2 subgroup domain-containing protein n=1 Tax=Cinchona calisaya TaxID=153742 RepID=A0ABD2YYJ3_9GENT